jgi:RNA polymerase-binding transcription factor DksA
MSNVYSDVEETDRTGYDSTKNRELEQTPMSAVQKRRAALEELDEAKFSVCVSCHTEIYAVNMIMGYG